MIYRLCIGGILKCIMFINMFVIVIYIVGVFLVFYVFFLNLDYVINVSIVFGFVNGFVIILLIVLFDLCIVFLIECVL